jgi:acetylornithine deacetylase
VTDVVALAAELLAISSTTYDEGPIVEFVSRHLIGKGWSVSLQEVTPGRSNIWATRAGGVVTMSTHVDTVPPYIPPRLDGDWLYGRGSCDAKGIVASMLAAADALAESGEERVDLLFVVGEEKGSDGARLANQLPATSRFLINGEPTESALVSGAKGSQRVIIRTHGRAAHSAYPHLGVSALKPMLNVLASLDELDLPSDAVLGDTTINVGFLRVGNEANIVPAEGEAEMMIRLVGDREVVTKRFHTLPGFRTGAVAFTTDIPLLARWGTPLLFGPGSIRDAHTANERVSASELRESVGTYVRIVRTLLADAKA